MRWRATVVVRLTFAEPRDGERIEHEVKQSLAERSHRARLTHIDPGFAFLRLDGRTRTLQGAGAEVVGVARGLGVDVGASAEVVHWAARPRGPARLVRRRISRSTGRGGPSGGPGTAGVREPRRPYPPGFPPMEATVEPTAE